MSRTAHILTRLSIACAILVQTLLPGAVAAFAAQSGDVQSYICAPSGEFSSDLRLSVNDFALHVSPANDNDLTAGDHCAFCVGANADDIVLPPLNHVAFVNDHIDRKTDRVWRFTSFSVSAPLNARAPPFSHSLIA